jgi:hypothetical protein
VIGNFKLPPSKEKLEAPVLELQKERRSSVKWIHDLISHHLYLANEVYQKYSGFNVCGIKQPSQPGPSKFGRFADRPYCLNPSKQPPNPRAPDAHLSFPVLRVANRPLFRLLLASSYRFSYIEGS